MKALGRTKFTDHVAHKYIILDVVLQRDAKWFLAKVQVFTIEPG